MRNQNQPWPTLVRWVRSSSWALWNGDGRLRFSFHLPPHQTKVLLLLPCIALYIYCAGLLPAEFATTPRGSALDSFPIVHLFLLRKTLLEVSTAISHNITFFQVGWQPQGVQKTNAQHRFASQLLVLFCFVFHLFTNLFSGYGASAFLLAAGTHPYLHAGGECCIRLCWGCQMLCRNLGMGTVV